MLRELIPEEIKTFLTNHTIGRIGCTDGENVYIVPLNFRLEENSLMCYSMEGLKIEMMRLHPSVCFEIDEIRDTFHWTTIVINGTFEEIKDLEELNDLRSEYNQHQLVKRVTLPTDKSSQSTEAEKVHPEQVFYRIHFKTVTGRCQDGFN